MLDVIRGVLSFHVGDLTVLLSFQIVTIFSVLGAAWHCWGLGRKRATFAMLLLFGFFVLRSIQTALTYGGVFANGVNILELFGTISSVLISLYITDERPNTETEI